MKLPQSPQLDPAGALEPDMGRAKRSNAGKIRTNRFLDEGSGDDAPQHSARRSTPARSPADNASASHSPPPAYTVVTGAKSPVVLQAPMPVLTRPSEHAILGLWVGHSIGRWRGNKLYAGALLGDQYLAVGADVFLKSAPGAEQQYIARIVRMYERAEDMAKVVTCKWFYRADETILSTDPKRLAQVSSQHVFMSGVMDDNIYVYMYMYISIYP